MKLIALALGFLFTISLNAQKRNHQKPNFTTEQKTQLLVKKMTMALDLTEKQANKVTPIIATKVRKMEEMMKDRKANKESHKNLSSDERFNLEMNRLDEEAKVQKLMKDILSKEQYASWKEMQKRHSHKMKMRHARKEGFKRKHHQKEA